VDFTSTLYLGLRHPAASLEPWHQLSRGTPAAIQEPPGAEKLATRLAALQGFQRAVLMPSTFHAMWDQLDEADARHGVELP